MMEYSSKKERNSIKVHILIGMKMNLFQLAKKQKKDLKVIKLISMERN